MSRVFISYSHNDFDKVNKVNDALLANRIYSWFDKENIKESDRWEINIATAISACDVFLVFYSQNYRESSYCNKEYSIMRNRVHRPDVVIVGLDDSKDSFIEHDATGYQFIDYKSDDTEDLCKKLLENRAIKKCSLVPDARHGDLPNTHFFNALKNLKMPRHYTVLEPLMRFLMFVQAQEKKGKYISPNADFSSLTAYMTENDSFDLALEGERDFSDVNDAAVRDNYIKNLMHAAFKFGRTEFYKSGLPPALEFESVFTTANHRFAQLRTELLTDKPEENIDAEIYALFNGALNDLYIHTPPLDELLTKLGELFEASKYYESLESRFGVIHALPYEINPFIIEITRRLFAMQNAITGEANEYCFPVVTAADADKPVPLEDLIKNGKDNVFLRGTYGSGKSFILKKWFKNDANSFYVDLVGAARADFDATLDETGDVYAASGIIRNFLERQEPLGYKINFYKLYNYSVYDERITILLDNFDNLSEENRKRVLAEVDRLSHVFRIVLVSTKHDIEGKLSLNKNSDNLEHFKRYELLPLRKKQFIFFLREKIRRSEAAALENAIAEEFEKLDENDEIFTFFDNFTKLDILYRSVSNWNEFSVLQLKKEFDAKIKVYRNIFESNQKYSLPQKIASLFSKSVVDIEDVIVDLVKAEISDLKKTAYFSDSLIVNVDFSDRKLRFRDYYPVLTKILGQYLFVNEDVHSYFAASYIYSQINENNIKSDFAALQSLLSPVKKNYAVLEYLREFDILREIDTESLLLAPEGYEELVLTLYKIIQYYNGAGLNVQREFLKNAKFTKIDDKFFFGAENIERAVVPPCVTQIGRAAFSNMPRLKEIDFAPRGVKLQPTPLNIRPWAILNCPELQTIRFGYRDYNKYEHPLFSRCEALSKIEIGGQNTAFATACDGQMLTSKDGKILYCSVNSLKGELVVPDGVEIIEDNALSYLQNVTKMVIPASVKSIATNFSDFCDNLQSFEVSADNETYFSDGDGNVYTVENGSKILFRVPSGLHGSLRIGQDVNVIGSDSISCCIYLDEIYVPSSVSVIENYAFADTYSLKRLIFEDIDCVNNFGTYIFLSTNADVKVIGDREYSLDEFNAEFCYCLSEVKQSGRLRGRVTADIFRKYGFEIIQEGNLKTGYDNEIVIVRDITLFKIGSYREQDFNIFLIGLTEYNSILLKTALEAEKYIRDLITQNHIDMVILSRNLPMISHLENKTAYSDLLIARYGKSSSATARELSKIISELGGKNV